MRLRRWIALAVPVLVVAAAGAPAAAAAEGPSIRPLQAVAAAGQRPAVAPLQVQAAAGQPLTNSCGQDAARSRAGLPDGARVYCVHPTTTSRDPSARGAAVRATAAAAVPDWCVEAGATWFYDRGELCRVTSSTVDIAVKKGDAIVLIGGITFRLSSDLKTNPTSTIATEDFSIAFTGGWGETAGLTMDLEVICTGTCGAATSFPHNAPVAIGETLPATIEYTDAPNGIDHVVPTYTLLFTPTAPGLPGTTRALLR